MMIDPYKVSSPLGTAFTMSIEAAVGVSTGISAHDRAHTIKTAARGDVKPQDIRVPGHVFPLKAREGGVLVRAGHTEASIDLARLAGKLPSAVICEIISEDGTMARRKELDIFAKKHDLPIVSIEDLIAYRMRREKLVILRESMPTPSKLGTVWGHWFESRVDQSVHVAFTQKQSIDPEKPISVRVYKQKPAFDALNDVDFGVELIHRDSNAIFLYLGSEHGLTYKEAVHDPKLLGIGAQILASFGVSDMILYGNSTKNQAILHAFGINVLECRPIKV
jgi:3,4-dihydroxy 2-butanone 4-phosphate synthase/GTP cyclohydrolase II